MCDKRKDTFVATFVTKGNTFETIPKRSLSSQKIKTLKEQSEEENTEDCDWTAKYRAVQIDVRYDIGKRNLRPDWYISAVGVQHRLAIYAIRGAVNLVENISIL